MRVAYLKHASLMKIILLGASLVISSWGQSNAQQWHPVDISFTTMTTAANPYLNVTLEAAFTGPGGTTLRIPGFIAGGNTWKVRFAPTKVGAWSYVTTSSDPALSGKTGTLTCIANTQPNVHGRLGVNPANPHHFRFEDGTPYFLMGGEIDWLALISVNDATLVRTKEIVDMYASHGFTQIIMNAYAWDTAWKTGKTGADDFGPPAMFAWGGSNGSPDHTRLNPDYWNHYDKVVDYMFQKGVGAYIMFKVYNKMVSWPAKGSANDEMYFANVVARYQAYPNIVWSFAKESFYETDHAYIKKMMDLVTAKDAYKRLRTTHDDVGRPPDYAVSATNLDFRTDQQATDVYSSLMSFRNARDWPIYNAELGYEIGNDGGHTYSRVAPKEEVLRGVYEVLMAGGYPAYYYTYHAWDVVKTAEVPNGLKFYKFLTGFIGKTDWYAMTPNENLLGSQSGRHCLAKAGTSYLVYFSNGGSSTLAISGATRPLTGKWMNAHTGVEQDAGPFNNGSPTLTAPWSNAPSILYLSNGAPTAVNPRTWQENLQENSGLARGGYRIDMFNLQGELKGSIQGDKPDMGEGISKAGLRSGVYLVRLTGTEGEIHPLRKISIP